jgi:hypothetical protein
MSVDFGQRQFYYHSPTLGTVVGVYPIGTDRRLYVDVVPLDHRGAMIKVPVFNAAGSARHLRLKMTVVLFFIDGNPQSPIVLGHHFNAETTDTMYADPLHPAHANIDDHVLVHEETGVFARLRSRQSTPAKGAPDGSPVVLDMVFNSGTKLQVSEYDPTGYTAPAATEPNPTPPPKPTRVNASVTLPSGLVIAADEPSTGQVNVAIQHPAGTTIIIEADGTVTITSPTAITHQAPTVTASAPQTVPALPSVAVPAPTVQGESPALTIPPQAQVASPQAQSTVDGVNQQIAHVTGEASTLIDGAANAISHEASKIGLAASGTGVASLDDSLDSALTKSHLTDFENNLTVKRLEDLVKSATANVTAGIPNSPAALALITAFVLDHVPLPSGSPVVKIQSS